MTQPDPPPFAVSVIAYATPVQFDAAGIWREGNRLMMHRDAVLPPVCVKCGQPSVRYVSQRYQWHHPAWYAVILVPYAGCVVYILVAGLIVGNSRKLLVPLCQSHKSSRLRRILLAWVLAAAGVLAIIGCIELSRQRHPYNSIEMQTQDIFQIIFGISGSVLLGASILFGSYASRILRPSKMNKFYAWFKGASPEFLGIFPAVAPTA